MKKKFLPAVFALVLALLLGGCNILYEFEGRRMAAYEAVPLMWHVTSPEGQTMYLFGSIHAGKASTFPLPDIIMDAFAGSDYLAVEFNPYSAATLAEAEAAAMLMLFLDGRTIACYVGDELYEQAMAVLSEYEDALLEMGLPLSFLGMFRFPMWSSILVNIALLESELSGEYGIDNFFVNEAIARSMEILEIESYLSQIQMMLDWSPELQAALLASSLDIEANAWGMSELYNTWAQGDYAALLDLMLYDIEYLEEELFAEYWYSLLRSRDTRMAETARQYMAEGKSVFFVVGAAHFVGEGGVVDLLLNEGYEVVLVR